MSNSSLFSIPTLSLLLWITTTSQVAALISKLHIDGQQHCASSNTANQFDESLAEFASISFPVNLTMYGGDDWAAGYCTSTYVAETGREISIPSGPSNKVTTAYLCLDATVYASSECYCIGRLGDSVCDHCQAANKSLAPSYDNFWANCLDGRSGIDCTIHHDFVPGFLFGWCDAPPGEDVTTTPTPAEDVTTTPTPAPTPTSSKDPSILPHRLMVGSSHTTTRHQPCSGWNSVHPCWGHDKYHTCCRGQHFPVFSCVDCPPSGWHNPFRKAMCPAVPVQRKPHRRRQATDPDR